MKICTNLSADCSPNTDIHYTVIRSSRRTIAIEITQDARVLVRCPNRVSDHTVAAFVAQKASWIKKHLAEKTPPATVTPYTADQLDAFSRHVRERLDARLPVFADKLGVTYHRVSVRAQRTRWGSCSGKGNLSFNCLLALVPQDVFDYVVVHELCHLREMNHAARFWATVANIQPQYKQCKKWLKEQGGALIARLP